MKTKKHILIFAAVALFTVCILPAGAVKAAAVPSLYAAADKSATVSQEDVNICVSVANNPQISTLSILLSYDSSILQYEDSAWGNGFSANDITTASDTGKSVNLSVVSSDYYAADGEIVTVRFKAVQDSDSIPVTLALQEMTNADMETVTDCQVFSRVRVPDTGSAVESGAQIAENEADSTGSAVENEADSTGSAVENEAGSTGSAVENEADSAGNAAVNEDESTIDETAETGGVAENQTATDREDENRDPEKNAGLGNGANKTKAGEKQDSESGEGQTVYAARNAVQNASIRKQESTRNQPAPDTNNAQADVNYETGAGIGTDVFLVLAVVCGILALVIFSRKESK